MLINNKHNRNFQLDIFIKIIFLNKIILSEKKKFLYYLFIYL